MLYIELAIMVALILMNGLLALAELAIVSSRRARLQALVDRGVIGSRRALALATDPGRFLSTVQIGITLVGRTRQYCQGSRRWPCRCRHDLLVLGDRRARAEANCAARSGKNCRPGGAGHDGLGQDCVPRCLFLGCVRAHSSEGTRLQRNGRAPGPR